MLQFSLVCVHLFANCEIGGVLYSGNLSYCVSAVAVIVTVVAVVAVVAVPLRSCLSPLADQRSGGFSFPACPDLSLNHSKGEGMAEEGENHMVDLQILHSETDQH